MSKLLAIFVKTKDLRAQIMSHNYTPPSNDVGCGCHGLVGRRRRLRHPDTNLP